MSVLDQLAEVLLGSAADAFVEVGVFVGAVLLLFQYINYRQKGALVGWIEGAAAWQPAAGALLGLTPGCGGAIFVMTLYLRGRVSFGTVVATLVATMGDSAFVLLTTAPRHFLIVSVLTFVVGAATGYAVDKLGISARVGRPRIGVGVGEASPGHHVGQAQRPLAADRGKAGTGVGLVTDSSELDHLGHEEGDEVDIAMHHRRTPLTGLAYKLTHQGFAVYWFILAIGLVFGLALLADVDLGEVAGWPALTLLVGALGTAVSILLTLAGRQLRLNSSHEDEEHKLYSLRETLVHGAMDTAFVTTWVFVAYVAYNLAVVWLGGGDLAAGELAVATILQRTGLITVVVGALVGLIPGCGPQILFISLFAQGLVPFAAVLANAISQDGDALFPLLALDRKSALWATVITAVPALLVGVLLYYLETNTGLGSLLRP